MIHTALPSVMSHRERLAPLAGLLAFSLVHAQLASLSAGRVDNGLGIDLGAWGVVACLGLSVMHPFERLALTCMGIWIWITGSSGLLPLEAVFLGFLAARQTWTPPLEDHHIVKHVVLLLLLPGVLWASRSPGSTCLSCVYFAGYLMLQTCSQGRPVVFVSVLSSLVSFGWILVASVAEFPAAILLALALTSWTTATAKSPLPALASMVFCAFFAPKQAAWFVLPPGLLAWTTWSSGGKTWVDQQEFMFSSLLFREFVMPSPGILLLVSSSSPSSPSSSERYLATLAYFVIICLGTWLTLRWWQFLCNWIALMDLTGLTLSLCSALVWQQGLLLMWKGTGSPIATGVVLFTSACQLALSKYSTWVRVTGVFLVVLASLCDGIPDTGDSRTWFEQSLASQCRRCARALYENPGAWSPSTSSLVALPVAEVDRFVWHYPSTCDDSLVRFSVADDYWSHQPVVFVGDSVVRFLFHAYIAKVFDAKHGVPPGAAHSDIQYSEMARFVWAPYIDVLLANVTDLVEKSKHALGRKTLVVLGSGPWDALNKRNLPAFERNVVQLVEVIRSARRFSFVWVEFGTLQDSKMLSREKREFLIESKALGYRLASAPLHQVCDAVLPMRVLQQGRETRDGVHYAFSTYLAAISVLVKLRAECP